MALTTDAPVHEETIAKILELDGFTARPLGRPLAPSRPSRLYAVKALVLTGIGGPDVLQVQERPDPPVGPGEVRIAVKAAGINFADTMARVGLYPDAPETALRDRLRGRRRGRVRRRGRQRPTPSATG